MRTSVPSLIALQARLQSLGAPFQCVDSVEQQLSLRFVKSREALAAVLACIEVEPEVATLEVNADCFPAELDRYFPSLQRLRITVDPQKTTTVHFEHPTLREVRVFVAKHSESVELTLEGCLPALEHFLVADYGEQTQLRVEALSQLLCTAHKTLSSLSFRSAQSWNVLEQLTRTLSPASRVQCSGHPLFWGEFSRASLTEAHLDARMREHEWKHLLSVQSRGFELDPWSCWWLVDRLERFDQLYDELRTQSSFLPLQAPMHAFLLQDPSPLRAFDHVSSLRIFQAGALSSDGLLGLCARLPALQKLELTDSREPTFDTLALASASLETISIAQCPHLRSCQLDCPALRSFTVREFDGNFAERLLCELLDGASSAGQK